MLLRSSVTSNCCLPVIPKFTTLIEVTTGPDVQYNRTVLGSLMKQLYIVQQTLDTV